MDTTRTALGAVGLAVILSCAGVGSTTAVAPLDDFRDSLRIAGEYHRAITNLSAKYADQPETAWYEFQRLTEEARLAQYGIEIRPCFARWWTYEFMGLELTVLSHELRRARGDYEADARLVEQLGEHMWEQAKRVLPVTASACGIDET